MTTPLPMFDVTARKAHQWTMVALLIIGFVVGQPVNWICLAVAGAIMLAGRFWWPADVVRQLVWRALEPAGLLKRRDVQEDHDTRRIARVLGGLIWLGSAALLASGLSLLAWILTGVIGIMVALDASLDFCALCFVVSQLARRHLLPSGMTPAHYREAAG